MHFSFTFSLYPSLSASPWRTGSLRCSTSLYPSLLFSLLRTGWTPERLESGQVSPAPLKPRGRDGQRPRAGPNCFPNRSAQSYNNSAQVLVLTMKPILHSDFSLTADSTAKNAFVQSSFADTSLDYLLSEERSIDSWSRGGWHDQNCVSSRVVSKN